MVTDGSQRTYLHDNQGPRVVDAGQLRGAPRRHQKDSGADDRDVKRSRRTSSHKSPSKSESGHRRKSSNSQSNMKSSVRPKWELDVIGQPHRVVPLGMEVETSVMASLRFPTADLAIDGSNVDITRLFAVASLVKDTRSGERVPVESGMLTGQKLFSVPQGMDTTSRKTDTATLLPTDRRVASTSGPNSTMVPENLGYFDSKIATTRNWEKPSHALVSHADR